MESKNSLRFRSSHRRKGARRGEVGFDSVERLGIYKTRGALRNSFANRLNEFIDIAAFLIKIKSPQLFCFLDRFW